MPLRFNVSSRAAKLSSGDTIVVSIPNSGRTWVRTFLCAYFCSRFGHPFSLAPDEFGDERIPRVIYTHDLYEHYTKTRWWDRLRSKYLVPRREIRRARILLLARDPRDAFVSHYHELTRRTGETAEEVKKESLGEMLRDPLHGLRLMVRTMNAWMAEFGRRTNCTLLRYEDMHENPAMQFRRVLTGLGEPDALQPQFDEAVHFSQFSNMRKMEASRIYDPKLLQPGDLDDPESYKVRRGKVGGYVDYFSPADVEYATRLVSELDERFGYRAATGVQC